MSKPRLQTCAQQMLLEPPFGRRHRRSCSAYVGGHDAGFRGGVAGRDGGDAGTDRRLHQRVLRAAHRRLVAVGRDDHLRIIGVLDERVGQAVAHGGAFEVDVHSARRGLLVVLPDLVRSGGLVVPRVRLTKGEEVVLLVLRVLLEELLQEVVHVDCDTLLVVVLACAVAEARARRLVDVEQIGV